jgi:hypothetical protein
VKERTAYMLQALLDANMRRRRWRGWASDVHESANSDLTQRSRTGEPGVALTQSEEPDPGCIEGRQAGFGGDLGVGGDAGKFARAPQFCDGVNAFRKRMINSGWVGIRSTPTSVADAASAASRASAKAGQCQQPNPGGTAPSGGFAFRRPQRPATGPARFRWPASPARSRWVVARLADRLAATLSLGQHPRQGGDQRSRRSFETTRPGKPGAPG